MPQTMKTPDAGRSLKNSWRSWRIYQHGKNQVNSKQEVIEQAQKEGTTVHFATLMDLCHFQKKKKKKNSDWATRSNIHRRTCTTWRRCGRWLRFVWSFHRAGILRVTHVRRQCSGCDFQSSRMRRTSKWCSVCQCSGKIGRCSKIEKNPKSECPDAWLRLSRHKWPKSCRKIEDPVVPLERKFFGHPLARLLWERQFEQALLELGWEKSPELGMYVRSMEQGHFCQINVDDIKMPGQKQNLALMWKKLTEKRSSWRTNLISWSRIFGMHSTWMRIEWNNYRTT